MKISLARIFACIGTGVLCFPALALHFELRPGAGATMVGNTFQVNSGSNFWVEVWMGRDDGIERSSVLEISSLTVALAFDRTNGSQTSATRLDNKLNVLSYQNHIDGLTQVFAFNQMRAAATNAGPGNNYAYAGGATRPYVAYTWLGITLGGSTVPWCLLEGRGLLHVSTIEVSAAALTHGEIYGDNANEAGLFVSHQGINPSQASPQLGASGYVARNVNVNSRRMGSVKYAVQANPEPGTWMALGFGALALARKRVKR